MQNIYKVMKFVEGLSVDKNQTDKSGKPYYLHPFRVMFNLKVPRGVNELWVLQARLTALLHDVIEDNPEITAEELEKTLFCITDMDRRDIAVIIESLKVLTHDKNTPYEQYINDIIAKSPDLQHIPAFVKHSDLRDNMSRDRLDLLPTKESARLTKKYTKPFMQVSRYVLEVDFYD